MSAEPAKKEADDNEVPEAKVIVRNADTKYKNKGKPDPKKNMRISTIEGTFSSAAGRMADDYIIPFMVHLGASNSQIGLLSSLQNAASMLGQLPAAKLPNYFPRKAICVAGKAIANLMWVFIILGAILMPSNIMLFIALFSLYSMFGAVVGTSWTSMMGELVPENERIKYFTRRTLIIRLGGFVSLVLSGYVLATYGFTAIFWINIILESASILLFLKINDISFRKKYVYTYTMDFDFKNSIKAIWVNKRLTLFTAAMIVMSLSVSIAGPFIAPFALKDIRMGYEIYAISLALGLLVRVLSYKYWGYANAKYGNKSILIISGIMISFVPLFYMFSSAGLHIVLARMFDGFAWSGFDIVVFNTLLGLTDSKKRSATVGAYTFMTVGGTALGAYIGGTMSEVMPSIAILGLYGFQVLFFFSFIGRLLSVGIMTRAGSPTARPVRDIMMEMFLLRPGKKLRRVLPGLN